MSNYGVPYKGSKNKIAKQIIDFLPSGGTLYDLFAGGCAITHCAMESGKYDRYIVNDIEPGITQLFIDAVNGKYVNEKRWISREDFFKLKESDPYVKYCWSFGNNGRDYLYSKEIEPLKNIFTIYFLQKIRRKQGLNGKRLLEIFAQANKVWKGCKFCKVCKVWKGCKVWKVWKGCKFCKVCKVWKGWKGFVRTTEI